MRSRVRRWQLVLGVVTVAALAGCATTAPVPQRPLPPPVRVAPPDTTVFAAPARGQSPEQLDRDRYDCAQWATAQTGFDPSRPPPPPPPPRGSRVVVAGPAPGSGVVAGAATGAILGAALANPWNPGPATLFGLAAGAIAGGAIESAQNQKAQQIAADMNAQADANPTMIRDPNLEAQAANYRRAMSACLDARGYSVR
jgi:uncharacterized protein YcfJ